MRRAAELMERADQAERDTYSSNEGRHPEPPSPGRKFTIRTILPPTPLTTPADSDKDWHRAMGLPDISELVAEMRKSRTYGRPIRGKHALHAALKRAGMTMTELSRVLGVPRTNVKSWLVQRIPYAMAKRIEDLLGVPATPKSWPAGIRE